jgi:hypothetical protein
VGRSSIYVLVGVLAAGVVILGYLYYQESRSGVDIRIGEGGVTIDGN